MENSTEAAQKITVELPYDPAIPLLPEGFYKKICVIIIALSEKLTASPSCLHALDATYEWLRMLLTHIFLNALTVCVLYCLKKWRNYLMTS